MIADVWRTLSNWNRDKKNIYVYQIDTGQCTFTYSLHLSCGKQQETNYIINEKEKRGMKHDSYGKSI